MLFAQDKYMVETLASHRANEALRERILPRAMRGSKDVFDAHTPYAVPERVAVARVAIAEEVGRRGVVREGVHDLLGRPLVGRDARSR